MRGKGEQQERGFLVKVRPATVLSLPCPAVELLAALTSLHSARELAAHLCPPRGSQGCLRGSAGGCGGEVKSWAQTLAGF